MAESLNRIFGATLFIWLASIAVSASGNPDPTFSAGAYGAANGTVLVTKRQTDGKILIGGSFVEVNGRVASNIARLNANGTVDTTFNPPDFYGPGLFGSISCIGIQSDGKIVVSGLFIGVVGEAPLRGLRRLNPDGSLDQTFNVFPLQSNDTVRDIEVQSDDRIVIGGSASPGPGLLLRLNANGTLDESFSTSGNFGAIFSVLLLPDGKILLAGHHTVKRLGTNGEPDNTFASIDTNNRTITDMVVRPDGKLLIVGVFDTVNGVYVGGISLLSQNGTPDFTFNQGNLGVDFGISAIELLANGKILIAGSFSSFNGVERHRVARLNADGTLDNSFVNNTSLVGATINDLVVLNDGKILVGNAENDFPSAAILLNSDGSTDLSTEYVISLDGRVRRITILSSGKIMIAGHFNYVNGVRRQGLARLNADGTLDPTFVPYFNFSTTGTIILSSVAEQPDGKLLVAGINSFLVQRLNPDGSQDATFSNPFDVGSTVYDIALLPTGQVVAVGNLIQGTTSKRVVRLRANGQPEVSFAPSQPNSDVYCVVRQPDGKLLIGGDFTSIGGTSRGRIARLSEEGLLDTGFDTTSGAAGSVFNLALQSDGKVLVVGSFGVLNGSNTRVRIGRLNSDGSLDNGFAQTINGNVIGLAVQSDGRILVGGGFDNVGGVPRPGMARLHSNGALDPSFDARTDHSVLDIKVQGSRKILVGGEFHRINGQPKLRIARLLSSSSPFDFDGDGRSDVAVYRPSSGTWFELFSSNSQFGQFAFGLAGDIVAPADYDADGKTDEAIFRPSTGEWWYSRSTDGSAVNVRWGTSGDLPRPSDFDGDGLADFVVYRPSNSVWYRNGSTGQVSIIQFGVAEDHPVVGDFDGDGKSDIAVFRPSTGDWWYAASGSGHQHRSIHWGATGDIPAPADYDGDGRTDVAVYRPSNGGWYVLKSSDQSFLIVAFGLNGDRPVPADYDGDGKADIAVFRPSNGVWYLMQTTAGIGGVQWGISTDTAIPNAFVP